MNGIPGRGTRTFRKPLHTASQPLLGCLLDEHPGEGGAFSEPFGFFQMRNISLKLSRDEMRNCPGCQPYCDPSILAGLSDLRNMLHSRVLPQKGSFALLDHIPLTHQLTPIRLSDSGFIVTLASCPSAACCTSPGDPCSQWGGDHVTQ